mmetsp:Transcript_96155/g.229035  ORF Transcript_96155/g.229035 Transcript_96155/m.229035 type:complete len:507 (+) Transcript_96155:19-1539(+)
MAQDVSKSHIDWGAAMAGRVDGSTYQEARVVHDGGDSVLGKLCGSLCCSLLGLAMYFGALISLVHNETSTVCVQRALQAARGNRQVDCDGDVAGDEGKLIYLSCPLAAESLPRHSPRDFGAAWLQGAFDEEAVKMRQEVTMLQCVEEKRSERQKQGDKTVQVDSWTYSMEWKKEPVNSDLFKAWTNGGAKEALSQGCGRSFQRNPKSWGGLTSKSVQAPSLMVGKFDLTRHLGKLSASTPVQLTAGRYQGPVHGPERRVAKDGSAYTWSDFLEYYGDRAEREWRQADKVASEDIAIEGNTARTCSGVEEIGCMRISYFKSSATEASHIGELRSARGRKLATRPWMAPPSWLCSGGSYNEVDLFAEGLLSDQELISDAESENMSSTWLLRAVGICLCIGGVVMFLNPLQTLANLVDQFFSWFRSIPVLGWLLDTLGDAVALAVGCAIFGVSVGIGLPSALIVMSISWCAVRPLLGIPMLLACVAALCMALKSLFRMAEKGKGKRKVA